MTFHEFFAAWAAMQSPVWAVPFIHNQIVSFLSDHKDWTNNTAVLQAYRGSGKSTLVALFVAYMLTQDPTLRFLLVGPDQRAASQLSNDVRRIITSHPNAQHLYSPNNMWREDKFFVVGADHERTASVVAFSIRKHSYAAGRFDWIIYDDIEVPATSDTPANRASLRNKLGETRFNRLVDTYELFVGTPHSYESIYNDEREASRLSIPVMRDAQGNFPFFTSATLTWADRMSLNEINKRAQASASKAAFDASYMLTPHKPYQVDTAVKRKESWLVGEHLRKTKPDWFAQLLIEAKG